MRLQYTRQSDKKKTNLINYHGKTNEANKYQPLVLM